MHIFNTDNQNKCWFYAFISTGTEVLYTFLSNIADKEEYHIFEWTWSVFISILAAFL